jgi:multidrug efflux pump subunit AcrA (membrane-fusion protein)
VAELKPGMSAEVEVILNRYENVLTIPAAAVVETVEGDFCWITTDNGTQRRALRLGDTDDVFVVVRQGVKEGDEVVLDPLATIKEAQTMALKPLDEIKPRGQGVPEPTPASSSAEDANDVL